MTTATLTVSRSQYTTAPHHAHFSGSTSTVTTGELLDAQWQIWVQDLSDGSTLDKTFDGPELGYVFDTPGTYRITLKIKGSGDGDWTEDSEDITVGTASYSAECWVDMDAGSNGVGTLLDPFNVMASAISYIDSNWVAGATNEHAIHCKGGTSETHAAGYGTKSAQGRLVIDKYGAGADPILNLNNLDLALIRSDNNHALAMVDIDINGGLTYPGTAGANSLIRCHSEPANTPAGFNLILLRCTLRNIRGQVYLSTGTADASFRSNGYGDFVALADCSFQDSPSFVLVSSGGASGGVRYYLDTSTYTRAASGFAARLGTSEHVFIRATQTSQDGSIVPYRIHAATSVAGLDTNWIVLSGCTFLNAPWIMPDDGNAATQDIKNVWIGRCFFTCPSTRFKALDLFVNENLAFRNNLLHNAGAVAPCVTYRGSDANTTASDNYRIENNVFVVQASGNLFSTALAWQFQAVASSTQTGVTFRNNLLVASAAGSGSPVMYGSSNGSPVPATLFDASDGNRFWLAAGTANWSSGFSTGNGSLATWQGATTFDDGSATTVGGGTDPLTDSTTNPPDATLLAASAPIDAGVAAPGVWIDRAGHIRTGTMDVGAHSYGDSTEPTAPTVDVAAVDPTDSVFIAARMRTING